MILFMLVYNSFTLADYGSHAVYIKCLLFGVVCFLLVLFVIVHVPASLSPVL